MVDAELKLRVLQRRYLWQRDGEREPRTGRPFREGIHRWRVYAGIMVIMNGNYSIAANLNLGI